MPSNTYSGKQFEAYIGLTENANLGAPAVNGSDTLYKLRLPSVDDIDFTAGVQVADVERSGQRVLRPTDHIAVRGGGSYTWSFSDYAVENEAVLQLLLQLVSEDTSPDGTVEITGNQATVQYIEGETTGEYAYVVISSPDTDKDRLMHSAVLTELTLSMDSGTNGGRLMASGTFYSGFRPKIDTESTSPDATAVDYTKGLFDCTTNELGGSGVILKSLSVTITNPCVRTGFDTVNAHDGEPQSYNRGEQIGVNGTIMVKMDDNSVATVDDFLSGDSKNISVGDGSAIDFDIPTAKYTGHTLSSDEAGVFIELPFIGTADGSGKLITIIAT